MEGVIGKKSIYVNNRNVKILSTIKSVDVSKVALEIRGSARGGGGGGGLADLEEG